MSYILFAYEDDVLGTEHPLWLHGRTRRGRDVLIKDGKATSRMMTGASERDAADAFYRGGFSYVIPDAHATAIINDLDRASWVTAL